MKRYPIMIVDDEEAQLKSLESLLSDEYIRKPFDPEDLKLRIKHAVEAYDYRQAGLKDFLTGLYNRSYIQKSIHADIALAKLKKLDESGELKILTSNQNGLDKNEQEDIATSGKLPGIFYKPIKVKRYLKFNREELYRDV